MSSAKVPTSRVATPVASSPNRQAILAAAFRVLTNDGHDALTVRRVAQEASVSTIGVYTWFGGKDGLVDAIWVEGFESFAAALRKVQPQSDPLKFIAGQAMAYRKWALAHPMHYRVMFLGAIPGHHPGPDAAIAGAIAFELLRNAVSLGVAQGVIASSDIDATTLALWGVSHGMVSLQLVNNRPSELAPDTRLDDRAFRVAIDAVIRGIAR